MFATDLADEIVARGHDCTVLGLHASPDAQLVPQRAGTADLHVGGDGRLSIEKLRALMRFVERFDPDLVQANGSDTLKYSALAKKLTRSSVPLVYRNISVIGQWIRYPGQRVWLRWLLGDVDHVASVTDRSRRDFMQTLHVSGADISTIPIGTRIGPPVPAEEARARLRQVTAGAVTPSTCVVMHIGSLSPEKNHVWLLDVFRSVAHTRPDAHLVLVGDGPLRTEVRDGISRRRLSPFVSMIGSRDDVSSLVAGADVLVLTSRIEGLPGVILEAAASGVPTISTDVGGVSEVVRDNETGILVRAGDRPSFEAALLSLLADPARRRSLGSAARHLVQERFEIGSITTAFLALYEKLVRHAQT